MALPNVVVFAMIAVLSICTVTANSPIPSPTKAPVAAPKSAPPPQQAMTPPSRQPENSSSTTPPASEPSPASVGSPPPMISATPADAPGPSANVGGMRKVGISGALVCGLLGVVVVM